MAVFLRQCHFQKLPLLSQKSQLTYMYQKFPLFGSSDPGKASALALKNGDSMNKEKHSLRHFATLQSRGSYPKKFLPTSIVTLIEKKQILKITLPQKNGSRIKTPSSKLLILVSFCWQKRIFYALMHSLIWFSPWFLLLKLVIIGVAFFLGHPVYYKMIIWCMSVISSLLAFCPSVTLKKRSL